MELSEAKRIVSSEVSNICDEELSEAWELVDTQLEKAKDILNGIAIIWANRGKKYVREDRILNYYIPKEKIRELLKTIEDDIEFAMRNEDENVVHELEFLRCKVKELFGE